MINTNRIVPVVNVDLISLYGLILLQDSNNSGLTALQAEDAEGNFEVTSGSAPLLAAEPVKTIDIASGVSAATVYFVAAYDYAGFSLNGVATTPTGTVEPDARTLYKAVLSTGVVTITKIGF